MEIRDPNELYLRIALHGSYIHQMEVLPTVMELLLHAFCKK